MPKTTHTTDARTTDSTMTPDPRKEAPRVGNDEGEPQMRYLMPAEGGSYHRAEDGSLRRAHKPTEVPEYAPITDYVGDDGKPDRTHHYVRDERGALKRIPAVPADSKTKE